MEESWDLFLLPLEILDQEEEEESYPLEDPAPYWSSSSSASAFNRLPTATFHPDHLFIPFFPSNEFPDPSNPAGSEPDPGSGSGHPEDDPATLSLDLFPKTLEPPERYLMRDGEMGSHYLGLGLGLGLGSGGNREAVPDWGDDDEFFIGRRSSVSESNEFSRARTVDEDGLRIIGFETDSDSDEQLVAICENENSTDADDVGLPLCWDCLQIDEDRRDPNEDFDWEEVDGRLELDRYFVGQEEDISRNIEWEVLLTVRNLGGNPSMYDPEDAGSFSVDDQEGFVYTSEHDEVLFWQFTEHDRSLKDSPPAAKSVVENLQSVVLTKEDVANNNTNCAICKDEIFIEEKAKRLPCSHHYHEECILPWLGIRNTCPLCRYEFPTDDPEYENWKERRGGNGANDEESRVRYDFEMLPEA